MDVDEHKIRVPSLFWIPLLACGVLLFFVDVFQVQYYSLIATRPPVKDFSLEGRPLAGFSINTPGCRIPYMDPFDQHVKKFVEVPAERRCNKGLPALFEANLTSISLVESALGSYKILNVTELRCCYTPFWRREPKKNENDDKVIYSKVCTSFSTTAAIEDEFIRVTCSYGNVTIYTDMFSFVPLKNTTTAKLGTSGDAQHPLNVLVIGLDAVSRLNLHRQMPKTVEYLKSIEAVELLGYNKVGDNTFPNLMPVLTGMLEGELRNTCWPSTNEHFDKCHFLWDDYKEKGYVTVYGEDSSWMGLFNYQRKGFTKQPTDYGYSYFNRRSEKEIGNSHNMNVDECVGSRYVYRDLLEYVRKFVVTMDQNRLPYFAFFWGASLSHDYLNKPQLGDVYYREFFRALNDEGHLKNTALFFISDHGIRWGDIRQTYQGRMEERLPFVIIAMPEWYKRRQPRAYKYLERNVRRLTTPFDLHETLKDLLQPHNLDEKYLPKSNYSRGYSLFSDITTKRTCEDAAIESHWCTCQQSLEVDKNSSIVFDVASYAVEYMNVELEGYAQCANLTLDAVLNARYMTHAGGIARGKAKIQDYMVTLRTLPGEGVFEVTVRHFEDDSRFSVMGTISRLNLYGKQSSCITDFHLKLYCYCKSLLR
ncbi:hypothetical protein NQ318_020279 [Aromia moschata]|uniref:DUF229 domain containing protein n=1 Tax=Aromia moschata TaxID=1265417 RepID=A0AAV8ZCC7_9CUCU|nr:hypothetical protein NQ318_020279 [Aromia moschata]